MYTPRTWTLNRDNGSPSGGLWRTGGPARRPTPPAAHTRITVDGGEPDAKNEAIEQEAGWRPAVRRAPPRFAGLAGAAGAGVPTPGDARGGRRAVRPAGD